MNAYSAPTTKIRFVCAVSNTEILSKRLLASPDFIAQDPPLHLVVGAKTAATAFNSLANHLKDTEWLVWVHQDVLLPAGWITLFLRSLKNAQEQWPELAVAGVYGTTPEHEHAGEVIDRGQLLRGSADLPAIVHGLDELLVAVRLNSALRMDPTLRWDFYASDLALQAAESGYKAAVVYAPCEHWSTTPRQGISKELSTRCFYAGRAFLTKWDKVLKKKGRLSTPCVELTCERDLTTMLDILEASEKSGSTQSQPASSQSLHSSTLLTLKCEHEVDSMRIEVCWICSDQTFRANPAFERPLHAEFYRSCGIKRFWYLKEGVSIEQIASVSQAFDRSWLFLIFANPSTDIGSVIDMIDEIEKNKVKKENEVITHSSATQQNLIYRVQTRCNQNLDPGVVNHQLNASEAPGILENAITVFPTSGTRDPNEGGTHAKSDSYWLIWLGAWQDSDWKSAFEKIYSMGPSE